MIELEPAPGKDAADTQITSQRMLALLLDVLHSLGAALPEQDADTPTDADTPSGMGKDRAGSAQREETETTGHDSLGPDVWDAQAEATEDARRQLRHLLDPPGRSDALPDAPALLQPVEAETQLETLHTWLALSQLSDHLGAGKLAGVEHQTDLQALPGEVLQAIEMYLDDDQLSSFGKVLKIGHLLLGQSFPNQ